MQLSHTSYHWLLDMLALRIYIFTGDKNWQGEWVLVAKVDP